MRTELHAILRTLPHIVCLRNQEPSARSHRVVHTGARYIFFLGHASRGPEYQLGNSDPRQSVFVLSCSMAFAARETKGPTDPAPDTLQAAAQR